MAGRGRGRATLTFNPENLGIGRGFEAYPTATDGPPPLYPPLGTRPHQPLNSSEHDYMLAVMKDFVNQTRDSCFALTAEQKNLTTTGVQIARYGDKIQGHVQRPLTGLDWIRYPKELAPSSSIKKTKKRQHYLNKIANAKKLKKANPDELLDKLEQKEKTVGEDKEGGEGDKSDANSDDDEDDAKSTKAPEDEDEEVMDEELDEGTDYANNYFDNGEDYIDNDDDGLDEGGIY